MTDEFDNMLNEACNDALEATGAAANDLGNETLPAILNPKSLPHWPRSESLLAHFNKCFSLDEKMVAMQCNGEIPAGHALHSPFYNVRQSLMVIARFIDRHNDPLIPGTNGNLFALQDPAQTHAIVIEVTSVRRLTDGKPLIELNYVAGNSSNHVAEHSEWICMKINKYKQPNQINATPAEWLVFCDMLKLNSEQLSQYERISYCGDVCEASFIVLPEPPVALCETKYVPPPSVCANCGKKGKNRKCGRCKSASYCSPECQRTHWKTGGHKKVCLAPVENDDSASVVFPVMMDLSSDQVYTHINFKTGTQPQRDHKKTPRNVHGDNTFIVKVQVPISAGPQGDIFVYDEKRTFETHFHNQGKTKIAYGRLDKLIRSQGINGLKMYMNAKRQGLNMRVFTDSFPSQRQAW